MQKFASVALVGLMALSWAGCGGVHDDAADAPAPEVASGSDALTAGEIDNWVRAHATERANAIRLENDRRRLQANGGKFLPATQLPPLEWDAGLARQAQSWADQCDYANMHDGGNFLQNVRQPPDTFTLNHHLVVQGWASERYCYNISANTCTLPCSVTQVDLTGLRYTLTHPSCNHYKTIVRRDVTRFGCGVEHCRTGRPDGAPWTKYVCNYAPVPANTTTRPF